MDLGHHDLDGAMRQRYLELDDRTEDAKATIVRGRWTYEEFQQMYDISWIYHENGLEGVVLSYPEIKSAVDNKIISDVSLLPTYRDIKNQKYCIDVMRDKALQKRFALSVPLLKELHGRLVAREKDAGVYRKDIPIHRTYFTRSWPPTRSTRGCMRFSITSRNVTIPTCTPLNWPPIFTIGLCTFFRSRCIAAFWGACS